ncbi:MAG: GntR family transcriptional regulator [Phycisphaerae bacterium]|nr:GntR family transcriptional regulator [Phycisphaerae bacterium]
MQCEPLQRLSLVDGAYAAIKQRILSGQLAPGTALNIDALRREMGVSNAPIREALRRLEHERWIETVPFRGAFVRPFDAAELADLYELREMLELAAIEKILPRPRAEGVARLAEALDEIRSALARQDAAAYLSADIRFHQAIVDMAENGRLSGVYATLVEQGRCFVLRRRLDDSAKCRHEATEHAELLEAIRSGHKALAKRLIRSHVRALLEQERPT